MHHRVLLKGSDVSDRLWLRAHVDCAKEDPTSKDMFIVQVGESPDWLVKELATTGCLAHFSQISKIEFDGAMGYVS
jgi:hypothetical protein